jgi:adenylate kinase family enzyme
MAAEMTTLPGSRILVTGLPGAGKTSLSMNLAERCALPHIEIDQLYFTPEYAVRETFLADLAEALAQPSWILDDFGAPESWDLAWAAADTLVWIDLPFGIAFGRAVRRTWRRLRHHVERIPGLRETWLGWVTPKHPVVLSLLTHRRFRRRIQARIADPRFQHLHVIRLRSTREVAELLGPAPYRLAA